MVGSKISGLSWADEVEKEEEEAQALFLQRQNPTKKLNPFGSARPREIVLEEKGIDWRNLDNQLQSSNQRKEKNQNKPLPPTEASIDRKDQFSVTNRKSELNTRRIQTQRHVCDHVLPSLLYSNQRKQNIVPSVPQLRLTSKNAMAEMQRCQNSSRLDFGEQYVQYRSHLHELHLEKENRNRAQMTREFNVEELMQTHHNREAIRRLHYGEREKENMEIEFRRRHRYMLIGPPVEDRASRGRHLALMESEHRMNPVGPMEPVAYGGRRVNLNGGGRMERMVQSATKKRDRKNAEDGEHGRRACFHSNMEGTYFGDKYVGEFGRSMIERSDWEEDMVHELMNPPPMEDRIPYDLKPESRRFVENSRKRGMASTPLIAHYKQRRRR